MRTAHDVEELERSSRKKAKELGYPTESLSDQALFGAYVLKMTEEYQKMLNDIPPIQMTTNHPIINDFFRRLAVDSTYIKEPLTDEQLQAAKAWKIEYLRRLRMEKVDESYINAYLEAWDLSRLEVFGNTALPHSPR